ncbi:hypothetical protein F4818DRAFT_452519 [Hypoxylon cercidicola]|nr:hypothetical protein F4818DRAFT_452519 [Hypoxylon cercidicola]
MSPKTKTKLLRRALPLLDGLIFESALLEPKNSDDASKDEGGSSQDPGGPSNNSASPSNAPVSNDPVGPSNDLGANESAGPSSDSGPSNNSGGPSNDLRDVLLPFVPSRKKTTPEEARDVIFETVRQAFLVTVKYEDVYRRLSGNKAFWYLILADWNSAHEASPFPAASVEKLIALFVAARRRYEAEPSSSGAANIGLTMFIDRWIHIIDDVNVAKAARASRKLPSLKPPKDVEPETLGSRTWPPAHFSAFDIAIMGQAAIREKVFGVDHLHKVDEEAMPTYPTDQSPPLDVRRFLCGVSLEETKPRSPVSLFLAPVAFMSDEIRREWYLPTGHKSRLYATVDEFINYAHEEFKTTAANATGVVGVKQHVIGLLTPWFFEKEWLISTAQERDQPIPIVWQGACFRAGMMVCLTRLKRVDDHQACRLVLFKPGPPYYWRPAQPSDRREKQESWIRELRQKLKHHFRIAETWIGGRAERHHGPSLEQRPVTADSVETSCEIIEEMKISNGTVPNTKENLLERGFELI